MTTISKKVCLLGDFAVGKTSLVRRFVYNLFDDKYIATIGVKVTRKTVAVPVNDDIVELTMMLWDLAGSDEFNGVRTSYLRGAAGAVLVCDLTRAESLNRIDLYASEQLTLNPKARLIIAANKADLADQRQISHEQLEQLAGRYQAPYYITSAKTGAEVENVFRHLARLLAS